MFRALLVNTFVSAVAFFIVSVIGLVLIPFLVEAYGLAQYGLLVLARLFLPTGIFGVFDFGFAEIATQAIARARVNKEWENASGQVTLLIIVAALVGASLAFALILGADFVTVLLKIVSTQHEEFRSILKVTGGVLLLVFPCMVLEGVIKGYEAFRQLRACEIAGTVAFAVFAVFSVWAGLSYSAVAYAYLGGIFLRALAVVGVAFMLSREDGAFLCWWGRKEKDEVVTRCRLMAANKVLGAAQAHASPMLIGLLLDATAVGVYDVIVRLPRFAKSILGLLNTAVLPVAARLEAASDSTTLARLNRIGLIGVAAISFPPLASGMLFSEQILRWWIGKNMTQYWFWQSAMFVIPALTALVSYAGTSLLTRPAVVSVMNRLVFLQMVIHLSLALALLGFWQERAFIFGQVTAIVLTFFMQMRVICREHNLGRPDVQPLIFGFVTMAVLLGATFMMNLQRVVIGPITLVIGVVSWCVLAWMLAFFSMFPVSQRQQLLKAVKGIVAAKMRRE